MYNYAQLNNLGIVIGVQSSPQEIIVTDLISIQNYDTSLMGKVYNGATFDDAPEPVSVINTKMTRLKFKQRLLPSERIAIRNLAKTDDLVFDFMDLVSEATYIEMDPNTSDGEDVHNAINHIASQPDTFDSARASVILNTPVTEDEAYK